MKKIVLTLFAAAAFVACNNQSNPPHGESGHKCTDECMKMMDKEKSNETTNEGTETTMEMKEHSCTDACKDGQHMYAHGEKGHQCSEECMKMNQK